MTRKRKWREPKADLTYLVGLKYTADALSGKLSGVIWHMWHDGTRVCDGYGLADGVVPSDGPDFEFEFEMCAPCGTLLVDSMMGSPPPHYQNEYSDEYTLDEILDHISGGRRKVRRDTA